MLLCGKPPASSSWAAPSCPLSDCCPQTSGFLFQNKVSFNEGRARVVLGEINQIMETLCLIVVVEHLYYTIDKKYTQIKQTQTNI